MPVSKTKRSVHFKPSQECTISIRAFDGRYVGVELDGRVSCVRMAVSESQLFTCIPMGRTNIHFKIVLRSSHGTNLSTFGDGSVSCNTVMRDNTATHILIPRINNKFAFQSSFDKYLSVQHDHSLQWNSDHCDGDSEQFTVTAYDDDDDMKFSGPALGAKSAGDEAPIPGSYTTGPPPSAVELASKFQETRHLLERKGVKGRNPNGAPLPLSPSPSAMVMTRSVPARGPKTQKPKARSKGPKFRLVHWRKVTEKQRKRGLFSVFDGLRPLRISNDTFDATLLEQLWCKQKRIQTKRRGARRKPKKAGQLDFLRDIKWSVDNVAREVERIEISARHTKYTPIELRNMILSMVTESEPAEDGIIRSSNSLEETLEFFERVFPDEATMQSFREHIESQKFDAEDVKRFGKAESIWFHCRHIPMVKERCSLWRFQMEFRQETAEIWGTINRIRDTCRQISGNEKMYRVFGYILVVGNFMNHGQRKRFVHGFQLDVFERMAYSKAHHDTKYTLLMYFVDMIRKNHPELSDWVEILDVHRSLLDRSHDNVVQIHAMTNQFLRERIQMLQKRVTEVNQSMSAMEKKRAEIERSKERDAVRFEDEKDEVPEDVFGDVMAAFVQEAEEEIRNMFADFGSAEKECVELATEMGEIWGPGFWWKLRRVTRFWREAAAKLDKIRAREEREAKRARIKAQAKARRAEVRARRARSKQRAAIQRGDSQRDAVYLERLKDVDNLTKDVDIQEKVLKMENIFHYRGW